jgi:hypothetical protein
MFFIEQFLKKVKKTILNREKVSAIRKECSSCHSFSDQKCVILYLLDTISVFPPTLHPSSPPLNSQREEEKNCVYMYIVQSLVYNFVRPKTTTLHLGLNYVWTIILRKKNQAAGGVGLVTHRHGWTLDQIFG